MRERIKILCLKTLAAFSLLSGFLPLILILGCAFAPEDMRTIVLFPLIGFLIGWGTFCVPKKIRPFVPFLGLGLLIWLCITWLFPINWRTVFMLIPIAVMLFIMPLSYSHPVGEEWPTAIWIICAFAHVASLICITREQFVSLTLTELVCLSVFALSLVMTLNRQSMRTAMNGKEKPARGLAMRNRLMVAILFLAGLAVAFFKELAELVNAAWEAIKSGIADMINWLLSFFMSDGEEAVGKGGGGMGDVISELGTGETNSVWSALEVIFRYFVYVLLAVIAVLVIWFIGRKLKQLYKYIAAKLKNYADSAQMDYVDEVESTRNADERAQKLQSLLHRTAREREKNWKDQNGTERVRTLYRGWMKKNHPDQSLTAREALGKEERFAELYDEARYSARPVSEKEADELRDSLK